MTQLTFTWCKARPGSSVNVVGPAPTPSSAAQGPAATEAVPTFRRGSYGPSHPWHYLPQGDNASPIPFERIPPSEESGRWLQQELPKNVRRRLAALRETLKREEQQLLADRQRYEEIVARGADALSCYDREIAYGGNDELARAATLALKFNHIRLGKGRVEWLAREVHRLDDPGALFHPGSAGPSKPTED